MDSSSHDKCLIADSCGVPVAHALLESPTTGSACQVRVLEGAADAVAAYDTVRLIDMGGGAFIGRIVRRRGDIFVLDRLQPLGREARENLRIPVDFDSFLYPLTGSWQGRLPVKGVDLSCGGIAFFCNHPLDKGERAEIVIPCTEPPLVLEAEILRPLPSPPGKQIYAAKFVNMVNDEEFMVREAVFSIQISSHHAERNQHGKEAML